MKVRASMKPLDPEEPHVEEKDEEKVEEKAEEKAEEKVEEKVEEKAEEKVEQKTVPSEDEDPSVPLPPIKKEKSESEVSMEKESPVPSNSVEIKRRRTPEEELQQLSELLSHAVSQQFNVLRRVRKFMDTVLFFSMIHYRWSKRLLDGAVNTSTSMPCLQKSEILLWRPITNSLLIWKIPQLSLRIQKKIYQ